MFLKISQNSPENISARVSFLIKLQASDLQFIKKETLAQVFSCEFCEIFKNNFFKRTPPVAASVGVSSLKEVGQNLRPLLSTIMEKNIC